MKLKIILWVIVFLGFFLRTVNLNTSPPGFNADEAALGYNAYSILKTGRDEWGEITPLVLKSFSDYKPGLYVYLDIPFIAALGLNEIAVRLPSVILGTLSIILVYYLSKEIFASEIVALSGAFLLAISPWHIHFSRGAWETNVSTFFMVLGLYAFIKSFRNHKWIFVSSISLIASMYTYQSPRLVVPLLVIFMLLSYRKRLYVKKNLSLVVVSAIFLIPFVITIFSDRGLARFEGLSIFSDVGPALRVNVDRGEHSNPGSPAVILFHNKIIAYSTSFLSHYLDHFSPNFLFISGDPLGRNKVPEMGQFYLFEIITILYGVYILIKERWPFKNIIAIWVVLAPVAAALTYQTPHALRAFNMVIPLTIISGLGLGSLIERLERMRGYIKWLSYTGGTILIIFFFARFLDLYFVHLPKEYALEWEYGFSQVESFVKAHQNDYQTIKITDRYDQPYILTLFYLQYDPFSYQNNFKQSVKTKYGFSTITQFGKYEFGPVSENDVNTLKNTLIIGSGGELEMVKNPVADINFPNGQTAFKIIESKGK